LSIPYALVFKSFQGKNIYKGSQISQDPIPYFHPPTPSFKS
jgi:hypothetical protein